MTAIVLASTSPRRHDIMQQLGVEFEVCPPDFEEVMDPAIPAQQLAVDLALGKAMSVAAARPHDVVIGADTFCVFEGEYLGKVESASAAKAILQRLAGNEIAIYTGLAVVAPTEQHAQTVVTYARIKNLSDADIDSYIESGIYADKAGAVSIEIVDQIDGEVDAALGLPLNALRAILSRWAGV